MSDSPAIKIFGERNSGTNYLTALLHKNLINANILSFLYRGGTGWKHGKPFGKLLTRFKPNLIIICVVRDLEEWLNSMYRRPYHLKNRNHDFDKFIVEVTPNYDPRRDHDVMIYDHEKGKNLFQLRYLKYYEYQKLSSEFNLVMVNLKYIQDHYREFIERLCSEFNLQRRDDILGIPRHLKTGRLEKTDSSYVKFPIKEEIKLWHADLDIEKEIDELTMTISKTEHKD